MKKLIVFLSFFIFFSCGNKSSVDIEEKRYNENKKVELNVEKNEKLNVIVMHCSAPFYIVADFTAKCI